MRLRAVLRWLVAATFVGAIAIGWSIVRRGFSARDEPSSVEKFVARRVRGFAVPARARAATNPVSPSSEAFADARGHFADHCAVCHANDGSGRTTIGQNLYPKAPDMREPDTQRLTDGELYYIIQNGIRLTGMPAWGKAGDEHDEDSWKLVYFIRHLNELTPAQLKDMEKLNPKTQAEIEEERRDEEFLRGGAAPATPGATTAQSPAHGHRH
jgi:mono/diheme cytochrome c family protein